ncbi:hypothetical protein [Neobacillus jeddahensis]|uniref:hypothetical protein n=1 Tax=Neobacillus jeddahensis TaxID=1461580 RepID=UPI00058B6300|nr:hypothetical protein [Neobacillus jeddahensis]
MSRGRPAKKHNQEEIENIVKACRDEYKINGLLKYSVVHKYALQLYEEGKIKDKFSEDFWRKPNRQGTLAIAKINQILVDVVKVDESETEKTISTLDAVEKLFTGKEKDKKELINKMSINEVKAKQYINKSKKLKDKIISHELEIQRLKEQRDEWKQKTLEMQNILFKFMEYSKKKGFPVENIFNTGHTRTKPVELILSSMFGENPTIGFDFEMYIEEKEKNNVVEFKQKEKEKESALDEYGSF